MSDPLNDPNFPDRPTHPDFWRIIDAVNWLDAQQSEDNKALAEILDGIVDVESVTYIAKQRALRISHLTGMTGSPALEAIMAALFMDGFAAGSRYQSEGGHRSGVG